MNPSINHANLTVVFATSDHIPTLLKLVPKVPDLKMIVCVDSVPLNVATIFREWSQSHGLVFRQFVERLFLPFCYLLHSEIHTAVESFGKANLVEPIPAYPDLIASICYTSVRLLDVDVLDLFNLLSTI
jgi:long-chain acyl-CoA synthetase